MVDADPRDQDTEADRFDLSSNDDEPAVAVPLSLDPDADGPTTGHVPGAPTSRAVPATPGSAAGPAVRAPHDAGGRPAVALARRHDPRRTRAPKQA